MGRQRAYRKTGFTHLLLILLLWAAENACSEVYRWIDTDGKVHYSDKKPKVAAEDITADVSKQNLDESSAEQRKLQTLFRPENDADREHYRKQQSQAQPTAENARNCRKSRELLHILSDRVQLLDSQGKEVRFTEKDRQQKVKDVQDYLEKNCNP